MFILADDLTGAADTGVAFAKRGLRTVLRLKPTSNAHEGARVKVAFSDSRNVSVDEAVVRVQACLPSATLPFYKKIDSVLRGHVAAELVACMQGLEVDRALVAPAFPAQGRITREGRQWVRGQPVDLALADVLAQQVSLPVRVVSLRAGGIDTSEIAATVSQPGIVIADAETDDHLDAIVRAASLTNLNLWCGSAGLAHALARQFKSVPYAENSLHPKGPTLIVAGSDHANTRQQLAVLQARGVGLVEISADDEIDHAAVRCVAVLQAGLSVALCLPVQPYQPELAMRLAQRLAETTLAIIQRLHVHQKPRLLLTGGDTALAVCAALNTSAIELLDEIEPGVPVGWVVGGLADGAMVITKSGGFGDRETLWRVVHQNFTGL